MWRLERDALVCFFISAMRTEERDDVIGTYVGSGMK